MERKIRVGIVGCGNIKGAHTDAYVSNPFCALVGFADRDINRAVQASGDSGLGCYSSADELFEREKPDAISVCTPPATHREVVRGAVARGIHVLCEKPLAPSSVEAEQMVKEANEQGVVFLVANCHLFHPQVISLKKVLSAGVLGRVTSYRNRFNWNHPDPLEAKSRGGALLDNGIHSIYLFRHICGEVRHVSAISQPGTDDIRDIRKLVSVLESITGVCGVVEIDSFCSPVSDRGSVIEIFGEKGSAVVDYGGDSYYMTEESLNRVALASHGLPGRFVGEVNHFINCIRGQEEPLIDAREGVYDIEIAERLHASAMHNRN